MRFQFPLKQHVGAPCEAVVAIGDEVKRGQLIAKPNGLGANIHSSVTGKVADVTETSVFIEAEKIQSSDYLPISDTEDDLAAITIAGVVGAGGAGFPAGVKFGNKIPGGFIIANAAECEPLLAHNVQYMEEHPEELVRGLEYLIDITGADKAYIAIKTKNHKAMIALGKACKGNKRVSLKYLSDMYPAGDERVIVREILGVTLEPGALPIVANAIISNVETIKNVVQAIENRKPVIDKDLTVTGRVKNGTKVFINAPLGTPIEEFISEAGGYIEPYGEIVVGGPFTGKSGKSDAPITKTTGGIIVAMPFPEDDRKAGILICECGADENRLREIAAGMGAEVVSAVMCKRMVEVNGRYRCDLPGICPGQAEKVLQMKKAGAEVLIIGTCQD